MTEIHAETSDSDLSTNSWTLIHETDLDSSEETPTITPLIPDEPEHTRDNGFLSFDEYLQERMLEHDYAEDPKTQKLKRTYKNKSKRGLKKCKAQNLGISVLIGLILGLVALASLCSTFSQQQNPEKATEVVRRKIIEKEIENKKVGPWNKMMEEMNQNIKELDALKVSKLLEKPDKKNLTQAGVVMGPFQTVPKNLRKNYEAISYKNQKCPLVKKPNIRTQWSLVKDLFLDTNLHALLSLVMTNIYLFALFADIIKSKSSNEQKTKYLEELEKAHEQEIRKSLFKELPFRHAKLVTKAKKKKTLPLPKVSRKTSLISVPQESPIIAFKKLLSQPSMLSENGKSECQRRFDAIDQYQRRFDSLKEVQKDRIKLLRQKFRNQVALIKETEGESKVRAEKITRTSQMFIRKLKCNREKYLLELKKVRELRLKVQENQNREKKDVAVGSYSVCLPPIFQYGESFKMIKQKFEKENEEIPKVFKF